jgi:hypothetical protein
MNQQYGNGSHKESDFNDDFILVQCSHILRKSEICEFEIVQYKNYYHSLTLCIKFERIWIEKIKQFIKNSTIAKLAGQVSFKLC